MWDLFTGSTEDTVHACIPHVAMSLQEVQGDR
jgi:hypothetical protein